MDALLTLELVTQLADRRRREVARERLATAARAARRQTATPTTGTGAFARAATSASSR